MSRKSATGGSSVQPFRSLEELAAAVSRNKGTVSRWTKRADWPVSRTAPWSRQDVPKILEWVEGALAHESTGGQRLKDADLKALKLEKLREEIAKIRAQRMQAETTLARERGELMAARDVEAEWVSITAAISNGFANLPSQVVPLALSAGMPHQASAQFQEQVRAQVDAILRKLSGAAGTEDDDDSEGQGTTGAVSA